MQIIQEGKAGLLKSKPGYHYPNFRLPREFQNLIGEDYKVFTTSFEGAQAFLLVFPDISSKSDESFTTSCKTIDDAKLENIEKSLNEIRQLMTPKDDLGLQGERESLDSSHPCLWAQPDSNRRPPPCKGGVITN